MWYHLSRDESLPNPLTRLRNPEFEFLDVAAPCFCLSPTVWQCVIAISEPGRRYIYEVSVCDPIPAPTDNPNVADFHKTREHRITQQVLEDHANKIPLKCVGHLEITKDLLGALKVGMFHPPIQCDSELELSFLWDRRDHEWLIRSDGIESIKRRQES